MDDVFLIEEDLSGGAIDQVWKFTAEKGTATLKEFIHSLRMDKPLINLNPSAIISLNLLNQLDILLCDHLIKQSNPEKEILDHLRQKIQAFHLQWILQKPGCLITDTSVISIHKDGHRETKSLIHAPLPNVEKREQWTWEFDSKGTYRAGIHSNMEVEALSWA